MPIHGGTQVYDVLRYGLPLPTIDCGNDSLCLPKCSDFGNFHGIGNKRNIEIKEEEKIKLNDTFNLFVKDDYFLLEIDNSFRGNCKIALLDLSSKLIFENTVFKSTQKYEFEHKIANLPNGFYNIIVQQDNGEIYNGKINIVR